MCHIQVIKKEIKIIYHQIKMIHNRLTCNKIVDYTGTDHRTLYKFNPDYRRAYKKFKISNTILRRMGIINTIA